MICVLRFTGGAAMSRFFLRPASNKNVQDKKTVRKLPLGIVKLSGNYTCLDLALVNKTKKNRIPDEISLQTLRKVPGYFTFAPP